MEGRGGNLFPWRSGWRVWGELGRSYPDTILSQALRSRLSQPDAVENLAKALAIPGLQDFLRTMSTGRCTRNHLLCEIFRNYKDLPGASQTYFLRRKGAPPGVQSQRIASAAPGLRNKCPLPFPEERLERQWMWKIKGPGRQEKTAGLASFWLL
jgi:hypothetical protein